MSVVTSIRDYVEVLNTQVGVSENPASLFSMSSETFPYILKICKETLWDLLSLKGLRDNFYRPYLGGLEDVPAIKALLEAHFFDSPSTYDKISLLNHFGFFNGFGNSFFLSLPGSIGTLIIMRRIILQGVPAGIAATLGSILASCFTIIFVTVGGRFLVLNTAFLELFYYLGILIPGYIVVQGLLDSYFRIIPATEKKELLWIGFIHFLLGASNQITLFKHIRGLTLLPYPTRFLGISDGFTQILYISGFCVGSVVFAFSAFYAAVYVINWWIAWSTMTRSRFMSLSNWTSIVILISLNLSILSYYGSDFLLAKAVGFLPNDRALWHTSLAPNTLLKDPGTTLSKNNPCLEFSPDPAPFDRPLHRFFRTYHLLKNPTDFKYRSFEELNYQGEKYWLHRYFRHGSIKPNKNSTGKKSDILSAGRAMLRSFDKAIGWGTLQSQLQEEKNLQISPKEAFTNRAKEDIEFDFAPSLVARIDNLESQDNIRSFEEKFKRNFFGQIGLIPGRLPITPYGPFDTREMSHKGLAFANPVYKALLSFDIDLFLKRQPPNHSLSTQDEHNLFLKRQLLERYINTQRDYFDNNFTLKNSSLDFAPLEQEQQKQSQKTALSAAPQEHQYKAPQEHQYKEKEKEESKNFDYTLTPKMRVNSSYSVTTGEDQLIGVSFIKSLANQTYKHQFKGTLEIVRQMFAVSLDCPNPSSLAGGGAWEPVIAKGEDFFENDRGLATPRPKNPRILKFDQPLYTRPENNKVEYTKGSEQNFQNEKEINTLASSFTKQLLHEELFQVASFTKQAAKKADIEKGKETYTDLIGFQSPLSKKEKDKISNSPDLSIIKATESPISSFAKAKASPFLEPTSVAPFYAGWDNQRRQLVLTQRYLPRKDTMIFQSAQPQSKKSQSFFTTWPIPELEPGDFLSSNWRVPSRSIDQMLPPLLSENKNKSEEILLNEDDPQQIQLTEDDQQQIQLKEDDQEEIQLNENYQEFVELWKKKYLLTEKPGSILNEKVSNNKKDSKENYVFQQKQWPFNILYTQDLDELEDFDLLQAPYFVGVKRGGFIWPGGYKYKVHKN